MSDTGQGDRWQDSETSWHPPDSMRAGAARPVTPPRHSSGPSVEGEHDERSGSVARPSGHSKLWPPPDGASLLFPRAERTEAKRQRRKDRIWVFVGAIVLSLVILMVSLYAVYH